MPETISRIIFKTMASAGLPSINVNKEFKYAITYRLNEYAICISPGWRAYIQKFNQLASWHNKGI
jgi:hypothetical protein